MIEAIDDNEILYKLFSFVNVFYERHGILSETDDERHYRREIISMVTDIDRHDFLVKIYHYILVKYKKLGGADNE
jgi:hypothetical protein